MSNNISRNIKTQIRSVLDGLVTSGSLGCVIEVDLSKDVFSLDIPKYPAAILGMPAISSAYESNRTNQRSYVHDVLIMQQWANLTDQRSMEDLQDVILNAFDNNPTLNGASDVAVEPAASSVSAVSTADKTFIVFNVTLKARAIADLTF